MYTLLDQVKATLIWSLTPSILRRLDD